jgi:thiol-disulfide isomerase/thioredoxin
VVWARSAQAVGVRRSQTAPLWAAPLLVSALGGCGGDPATDPDPAIGPAVADPNALVGYDVRRLRPGDEPLAALFDRVAARAIEEQKRVVVLFSADWCHRCRRLEAELGSSASASAIDDVRILMLKEEDWEGATRLDEFKALRLRWEPVMGTYPLMVLLDPQSQRVEEMKQAKERLEVQGLEPTLANWFDTSRVSAG